MPKSIGIDGGDYSVTVVGLDGTYRKTRLVGCQIERFADGGGLDKDVELAMATARAMRAGRLKGEEILGHPCDEAVLRKISLPFTGRDALRKVIKSEAENAIHSHAIDDMVVDFHEFGESEGETRVLVAAVPKSGLRGRLSALSSESVEPERVDLDTMALFRVAHWCGAFDTDSAPTDAAADEGASASELPALTQAPLTAVLDIGDRSTRVLLVAGDKLVDMRTIRLGGAAVVEGVARKYQLPFEEARDAVAACVATGADYGFELAGSSPSAEATEDEGAADGAAAGDAEVGEGEVVPAEPQESSASPQLVTVSLSDVQDQQTDFLQRLARELVRFLTASGVGGSFAALWVAGNASRGEGMHEMLGEVFGCEPRELDVLAHLSHSLPEEEAEMLSPRIATAVGLALASLGGPTGFDFRQEDLAFTRGFDRVKFPLAIACFFGLFAALVYAVKLDKELQNFEERLGKTYAADPKKPVFYGQLYPLTENKWFENRRNFSMEERGKEYGYRELIQDLTKQPVAERVSFVRKKLARLLAIKQEESGIYENVTLESGLSVLLRLFEGLERVESALGKYVLVKLDLNLATGRRELSFTIGIRGADFRARQASLMSELQNELARPDTPFKSVELGRPETLFADRAEKNVSGAYYQFDLEIKDQFGTVKVGS